MVGTPEELFGMGQPNSVSTLCMERAEDCRDVFFSVFWFAEIHAFGTTSERSLRG